jgi:hypothetical protein
MMSPFMNIIRKEISLLYTNKEPPKLYCFTAILMSLMLFYFPVLLVLGLKVIIFYPGIFVLMVSLCWDISYSKNSGTLSKML